METAATTRKVVVYGAPRCGKTSLMRRWSDNEFSANESPTIGVNIHIRNGAQVWDAAGEERFHDLVLTYLDGAHAVLFLYNIANRSSFDQLKSYWIPSVLKVASALDFYLVGTHLDLEADRREVPVEEAVALAACYDMHYGELSAKTGQSMDHLRLFIEHPTGNTKASASSPPSQELLVLDAFPKQKPGRFKIFLLRCCCCCCSFSPKYTELQ